MKIKEIYFFIALTLSIWNSGLAQIQENTKSATDTTDIKKEYEDNAKKATINGTYIPKDLDEAIVRLKSLSGETSLEKFRTAPEEGIDRKLHFGLGQWMIVKWRFYEGSRFEHYLRNLGLLHPDDMADFMIICLHRSLNNKDLEVKKLVIQFKEKRKQELIRKKSKKDSINTSK